MDNGRVRTIEGRTLRKTSLVADILLELKVEAVVRMLLSQEDLLNLLILNLGKVEGSRLRHDVFFPLRPNTHVISSTDPSIIGASEMPRKKMLGGYLEDL